MNISWSRGAPRTRRTPRRWLTALMRAHGDPPGFLCTRDPQTLSINDVVLIYCRRAFWGSNSALNTFGVWNYHCRRAFSNSALFAAPIASRCEALCLLLDRRKNNLLEVSSMPCPPPLWRDAIVVTRFVARCRSRHPGTRDLQRDSLQILTMAVIKPQPYGRHPRQAAATSKHPIRS